MGRFRDLRCAWRRRARPLSGIPKATPYEAAVSVMMRMVFLFFAEERELPSADELYSGAYAVSTIREQL